MYRKTVLAGILLAGLAACGSGQDVTVTIGNQTCLAEPDELDSGSATFTVKNHTGDPVRFKLTENDGEGVASLLLEPDQTKDFTATLDEDDVYHLTCGSLKGHDIEPKG